MSNLSGSNGASVHRRTGSAPSNGEGVRVPTPSGGEILLTRRHFLYGALGVGALAAVGGGTAVVIQATQNNNDDLTILEVPEAAVTTQESFTQVEDPATRMGLIGSFDLPFGTLVWANDNSIAATLQPTEGSKPLTQVGLLSLASGNCPIVLEQAVGQSAGFEIYDVRATTKGVIWTEADILDGVWRVYAATSDGASIGTPRLLEEGGTDWETPSIAAVGNHAFWQVLPRTDGNKSTEDSLLKRASFGSEDSEVVYTSHGRMSTPPYADGDSVVITPRADSSGTYYQLTRIDADSGSVTDTMVLPQSMKPLEAGYGSTGFMFSFDAIYNYGGGIANLGTYVPASTVSDGSYSDAPWFRFARTPSAPPAWCGGYLMVRSTTAVCGVNLDAGEYFAFDVADGADYGEYLASTGAHDTVVTYTNIDHQPLSGEAVNCCRVRVWAPLG